METFLNESIPILRVFLNDLDSPYKYSDNRLSQLSVVAASVVQMDVPLLNTYQINIASRTIVPDPVELGDYAFINLFSLKAACIADLGQYRVEAMRAGIKARLGPANFETIERLSGFNTLLEKGPCAMYEEMAQQYRFGNSHLVRVILSPFVSNTFDPDNLRGVGDMGRMFGQPIDSNITTGHRAR